MTPSLGVSGAARPLGVASAKNGAPRPRLLRGGFRPAPVSPSRPISRFLLCPSPAQNDIERKACVHLRWIRCGEGDSGLLQLMKLVSLEPAMLSGGAEIVMGWAGGLRLCRRRCLLCT